MFIRFGGTAVRSAEQQFSLSFIKKATQKYYYFFGDKRKALLLFVLIFSFLIILVIYTVDGVECKQTLSL